MKYREYFVVKIFSDSLACEKIKRTKYMHNINNNVVQGRLSENCLTRKIFHEIFAIYSTWHCVCIM